MTHTQPEKSTDLIKVLGLTRGELLAANLIYSAASNQFFNKKE